MAVAGFIFGLAWSAHSFIQAMATLYTIKLILQCLWLLPFHLASQGLSNLGIVIQNKYYQITLKCVAKPAFAFTHLILNTESTTLQLLAVHHSIFSPIF